MLASKTPWVCRACARRLARQQIQRPNYKLAACNSSNAAQNSNKQDVPNLPAALLIRARSKATEHATLNQQATTDYTPATLKRLGTLTRISQAYNDYTSTLNSIRELHSLLSDPESDPDLRTIATEDLPSTTARLASSSQTLKSELLPKHPFAHLPCLIELRPGVGGEEAALFAGDLLRMYQAFCARKGIRVEMLKFEDSTGAADPGRSDAPLQEAILHVVDEGSYDLLRGEAGVHRVQRVPATETKGRTHTSAASVLVLPSLDSARNEDLDFDDPQSDYYVSTTDVRVDVMRSSGAGGQHVNTTDSAVRLTHNPTNTVVAVQETRSQMENRRKAWAILRSRLAQQRREAREEEMLRLRRSTTGHGKSGRQDKVRTYNWGQKRVTDHRCGVSSMRLDEVMKGGEALEEIMEGARKWIVDRDIEGLMDEANEEETKGKSRVEDGSERPKRNIAASSG